MINIGLGILAKGRVVLEKGTSDGVTERLKFENVILNNGINEWFDRYWNGTSSLSRAPSFLYLGTGTSQPSRQDAGLENVAASTCRYRTASGQELNKPNVDGFRESAYIAVFNWGEGEAQGTWTELGLGLWDLIGGGPTARGSDNTYAYPFSRTLIKDANNNPISLTVLPNEWLRVFYEISAFIPLSVVRKLHLTGTGQPANAEMNWAPNSINGGFFAGVSRVAGMLFRIGNLSTDQGRYIRGVVQSYDVANRSVHFAFAEAPKTADLTYDRIHAQVGFAINANSIFTADTTPFLVTSEQRVDGFGRFSIWPVTWDTEDQGTATGATATTLQDTTKTWTVDQFAGMKVGIIGETGSMQEREIVSNTADTLTITPEWDVVPDATSLYEIRNYDD